MGEIINPYIAGAPVTEARMFFGREDVFDWIEKSITGQYAEHILVIHGQRRVGKTSVLKQLGNRLPSKYIPVFFDLQGRTHTTLDRFLWWLAHEIVRVLKQECNIDVPLPEKEAFAEDAEFFENHFLPDLQSIISERTLLLTFDEFDNLEESEIKDALARPLIDYLRRLMGTQGLTFIFSIGSSGRKLENMQASYTEFFKTALYKKISFLSEDQTQKLVTRPVEGILEYEPAAVERIYTITSGHPYFTQLTCHEVFARCQQTEQRRVQKADVEAVLDDVVERGTVNLKFVWDDATDLEKWILAALAQSGKTDNLSLAEYLRKQGVRFSDTDLNTSLLHLREKDVLTSKDRFIIQLLKRWLDKNRPIEQVREELTEVNPIANRYNEIGLEFSETKQYDQAIDSFQRALEIDPDNIQAQVNIAQVYMGQKDYEKAVGEFEKALTFDDEDVSARSGLCEAHLALGDAAIHRNRTREAIQSYQRVLGINTEHTEARQRMAEIQRQRAEKALEDGKDEDALSAFSEALKYTPEDPALFEQVEKVKTEKKGKVVAGMIARSEKEAGEKNWEAAVVSLEEAGRLAPEDGRIQERLVALRAAKRESWLGNLLGQVDLAMEAERWQDVTVILKEILAQEPDNLQIQEKLTEVRVLEHQSRLIAIRTQAEKATNSKHWEDALRAWTEYLAMEPGDKHATSALKNIKNNQRIELLNNLQAKARSLLRAEKYEESLTTWNEVLALNPDDRQEVEQEISQVRKAYSLAKAYGEAQESLSRKNYDKAVNLLKEIVVENADYKDASRLMAQAVELRRTARKWWQSRWLWISAGIAVIGGLAFLVTRFSSPWMAAVTAPIASSATTVAGSKPILTATLLPTPVPTTIPMTWSRLNSAQFLVRDTIHAIAINPSDPGVIYIGTLHAGVFKSLDGGISWQPAQSGMGGASIDTLVIDPQQPDTLYAGVYNGGLYKTSDGGANWVSYGPDFGGSGGVDSIIVIDPADHLHLYYAPNALYFESQDGGKTWSNFNQGSSKSCPNQIGALLLDPEDQSLYANEWNINNDGCTAGVYQSGDHGRTWTKIGLNGIQSIQGLFLGKDSRGNKLLIANEQNHVYFSTDDGKSWNLQTISCRTIAVDPQTPTTLYCGKMKGGLIKSTDGGSSWADILGLNSENVTAISVLAGASPRLVIGSTKVAISTDQGASWVNYNNGLAGKQVDLTLDPSNASIFYLTDTDNDYSLLYRSIDAGRTWNLISSVGPGSALTFGPGGTDLYRVAADESTRQLLHSTDQGARWDTLSMPSGCEHAYANPFTPGTLITFCPAMDPVTFYYSNNFGETWQTSSGGSIYQIDRVRLFFGGSTGQRVYALAGPDFRSDDGGKSWQDCGFKDAISSDFSDSRLIIDPQNPDHLLRTSKGEGVLISTDGCRTWTASNNGLGSLFVNTLARDPKNANTIYAGTDGGAYVSFNAGQSWGQINDGLLGATVVYSIVVDPQSNVYAATPYGIFKLENK